MSEVAKTSLYVAAQTPSTDLSVGKLTLYVAFTPAPSVPVPRRSRATVRSRMGAA